MPNCCSSFSKRSFGVPAHNSNFRKDAFSFCTFAFHTLFGYGRKSGWKKRKRRLWHERSHFVRLWQAPYWGFGCLNWWFAIQQKLEAPYEEKYAAKTVVRAIRRAKTCHNRRKCGRSCQSRRKCGRPRHHRAKLSAAEWPLRASHSNGSAAAVHRRRRFCYSGGSTWRFCRMDTCERPPCRPSTKKQGTHSSRPIPPAATRNRP